jgi:hypothetical protein
MAEIGIVKAGMRVGTTATQPQEAGLQKSVPSKFDSIRSQLSEQLTRGVTAAPTQQISGEQAANLESALRQRLTHAVSKTPADFFSSDLKTARAKLNQVTAAVKKIPSGGQSSSAIRSSLSSIEAEFQKSAQLIKGSKTMDMQSLLNIQMQLYSMDQNVQLFSKVVDQATSGVKTIFQTQVG